MRYKKITMASVAARDFARIGRSVVCIGRNYVEHASELGNAVPSKPFYFLKPPSAYLEYDYSSPSSQAPVEIPRGVGSVHHEVELAVVMGRRASRVCAADAEDYIAGYALAIDMTARDLQLEAKKAGLPWTRAKGFDTFLPVGKFLPKAEVPDPHNLRLWLKVNGKTRQDDRTSLMIFNIPQLIEAVSDTMTLNEGDIICTGTPKGVGHVSPGDNISAGIEGLDEISFPVVERK